MNNNLMKFPFLINELEKILLNLNSFQKQVVILLNLKLKLSWEFYFY